MKIIYTREDVERIVLEYTQRVHGAQVNHVRIATYYDDYCVVSWKEPAEPKINVVPLEEGE